MMNKILSNVVMHKDYSKDIVRILKSSKSDEVIRKKLSKYHEWYSRGNQASGQRYKNKAL